MWKREGLFSVSMVSLLLISGMTALISLPEDILPFNLTIDVSASFSGGNGTASNPYQISDVTQLQNMSVNLTANYILINDINASATIYWNSGKGFDPIGDSSNRFSGSLDGQNYNITDLFINRPSESYVGLIGATKGATITYVSLIDVKVSGDWDVGGLVGENRYGTVSNCFASGNVSGYFDVGGLVGDNRYGTVSNCSATGTVSGGYEYIGGLVGENYDGTVSNCFASGTVSGGYFDVGGLMGGNTYGTVSNCSATGNVSGDDYIGGLVGENYHGTVSNCYAIGTVSGNEDVGGLVGENRFGTVSNSYYCINYTFINNQKYVTPYGIYEHQFNAWINSNKSLDIDDYLFFNSSTGYYNISNIFKGNIN